MTVQSMTHRGTADQDRLAGIVGHAYRGAPYLRTKYRAAGIDPTHWSEGLFPRLPFTTKDDLRLAYPEGLLAVDRSEVAVIHESSGTTGEPTPAFFTRGDIDEWLERMLFNGVGLDEQDVVFVKTPYSMLTTAHQMHGAAQRAGATVIPAGNRTELMPYSRALRLLRDYRATVAYCMPVELMLFARRALAAGLDPAKDFPDLRAAVVNGEVLSPAKKRFLEELWSVTLFPDYGSTETTTLGGACAAGSLHLWSDRFLFEVLDPATGQCSPRGTGELVVTSYLRRAMPIVRYRMGDIVTVTDPACACGSDRPQVWVHGREADRFTVDGRELYPIDVEDVVYGALLGCEPVFWSGEVDDGHLTLVLEATDSGLTEVRRRTAELASALASRLGMRSTIDVVPPGTQMTLDRQTEQEAMFKPVYLRMRGHDGRGLDYTGTSQETGSSQEKLT
ncbi:phenylacetate--CoA ligase family protein [Streptomyces coelicoflavus]|uniref:Phenylacetate--CoA ligase family protein n=1 Tax=Streptomyces coelicoflavus TaxID=285562 RepID=A0A7K3PQM0_9ACTN|nr:AMP-binding protein [Streptomyces coelicoflavus]NEB11265.1 phenylacetate--CoA ligase family protein [Streptomyces coelicoflavus]